MVTFACYMTIFTYFLKWGCNRDNYGQQSDHLGKDNMFKQKGNGDEYKHREMWKKGKSFFKKNMHTHTHNMYTKRMRCIRNA